MSPFPTKDVLTVVITGAAGQIGYSLIPLIARGLMLGEQQQVCLKLLDIEPAMKVLEGVRAECYDSVYPLLTEVVITHSAAEAFKGADVAILCGAFPRKPGMERKDLLERNAAIFSEQGKVLGEVAEPHCRVLVVGNPANTNALLLATAAGGNIDRRNVTALTRLDHNRAVYQLAREAKAPVSAIKNVIIWGNHSGTQVPDATHAFIGESPIASVISDRSYFDGAFIQTVQQRGAEVMKLRGLSSAASAAKAITDHIHDWVLGTKAGTFVSMAVISDGNAYGVAGNLMYSFPVTCANGCWTIVDGLAVSDNVKTLMEATQRELMEERSQAGL